ncbi:MAG: hypothetical protein NT154_43785 [Verrucomicrobia bacterium]|nr:hypothetical protein [Verrucomicrobiota bacterium]
MKLTTFTLSTTLLIAGAVWAQDPQPGGPPLGGPSPGRQLPPQGGPPGQPRPPMDPMAEYLYPPDLIMRNAQDLGLSDDQRHVIEGEVQKTQTQFGDLHKKLQGEMEALVGLVKQEKADEDKVRSQLDKVLSAENEIKKDQLGMMVRIKNQLSGMQQGQLREMRRQMISRGRPGGPQLSDEERARIMMEPQRRQSDPGGPGGGPHPGGDGSRRPESP